MRLSPRTLSDLAEMVCGASGDQHGFKWDNFPYRSSSQLTRFFRNCDLEYVHDGTTRKYWVESVLEELNQNQASVPELPSDPMIRVLQELMDISEYDEHLGLGRERALVELNKILEREGLEVYLDAANRCHIRNIEARSTSASIKIQPRPLSAKELTRRKIIQEFLDEASEDEFIEHLLIPLFRQLGFLRVTPTGHRDKSLEYGKDIWMKYRLPTGHFIYFGAQVKKDKIDAAGQDLNKNISGILAQVRMALDHPIFDLETNRKHLLDHVYIISASVITKQARMLLGEHLDKEARRHIIFMDREELLDLAAMTTIELPRRKLSEDEIPF